VAAVALGLLLWNQFRETGTDPASTPSATPSTSQPAETTQAPPTTPTTQAPTSTPTPTPTPTATPSPSPTADPAAPVESALSAFSDEVGVQLRDGTLDQKAAKTLDDGMGKVRRALRDGDARKVSSETDKLVQDYDKGVQDGSITPDAATALDPLLADLTGAVNTYAAG
jgi:type V secretory pathway adhesin AidA